MVNAQDKPVLGKPAVVAATIIKDVATSGRADPSLSTDQEDQGRLAFEAGQGRVHAQLAVRVCRGQDRRGDQRDDQAGVGEHGLGPATRRCIRPSLGSSSVGGANIGVSAYSKYPKQALAAALCMTRYNWENQEAINEGLPPVTIASYTNPAVSQGLSVRRSCSSS